MDPSAPGHRSAPAPGPPPRRDDAKIVLKQLLVVSGPWVGYFMCGLSIGSTTVLVPQLRADASFNATIGDDVTSWLASAHTYSGVLGVVVLCALAHCVGRRRTFLLVGLSALSGYVTFHCSGTVSQILISELALGLLFGCQVSLSSLVSTEYTSPKYRGVFLAMKLGMYYWGVWVANAVGTFFHWRKIPLIGIIGASYISISALFWPESPYWLARRGRLDACAASHRWLKGSGGEAERELRSLIANRTDLFGTSQTESVTGRCDNGREEKFWKPVLLAILLMALYSLSGKLVCSVYALEIIKKVTSDEGTAYAGMLALDGVTVLSMYVAAGLSRAVRRRALLFTSTSIAITLLFATSTYLYATYLGLLNENQYAVLLLLSLFSISISCGPITMSATIYCELVPLRRRSAATLVVGVVSHATLASVVKLAPFVFRTFRLHGAFLFYGVSSSLCLLPLYIYLPETKGKTLREIQDCLNGRTREKAEEAVEFL